VEEVYKLCDLLTDEELDFLEEGAKVLLEVYTTAEDIDAACKDRK
jgi:hypothetical protein